MIQGCWYVQSFNNCTHDLPQHFTATALRSA
jgi:hypothetical protein